jgi:hypothetical protein
MTGDIYTSMKGIHHL